MLVTQLGCDTHRTDPLANLTLTTAAYCRTAAVLHELAHRTAGGKWLATGGGGYQWARVVPRAWTIYFAEMAGAELPDELPARWVERAEREAGHRLPHTLSEPARPAPAIPTPWRRRSRRSGAGSSRPTACPDACPEAPRHGSR